MKYSTKGWIGLGMLVLVILTLVSSTQAQTDQRLRSNAVTNTIIPRDLDYSKMTPELTYINGFFHYTMGTFNVMEMETLGTVPTALDTIILPDSTARGFVIRNLSSALDYEYWLNTDQGSHRYILAGTSQYVPCMANSLFVRLATPPGLLLEFGK